MSFTYYILMFIEWKCVKCFVLPRRGALFTTLWWLNDATTWCIFCLDLASLCAQTLSFRLWAMYKEYGVRVSITLNLHHLHKILSQTLFFCNLSSLLVFRAFEGWRKALLRKGPANNSSPSLGAPSGLFVSLQVLIFMIHLL